MLTQLSLVWQVWSVMLLGAILMMAVLFVALEWRWIRFSARAARRRAAQALLRLFTRAGDGCADGCIDCNRWVIKAGCLSCGRTRLLTATSTIATDGQTAASIAVARAINTVERAQAGRDAEGRRIASLEEHRRRAALAEFDDLDLDLADVAVN